MSVTRTRHIRIGVRLSLLALALNALVPIHLAFDLAQAVRHHAPAPAHHSREWWVLYVVTGHRLHDGKSHQDGKSHEATCPVCNAASSLAGIAMAAPPALPRPRIIAVAACDQSALAFHHSRTCAAYRSRAPPLA